MQYIKKTVIFNTIIWIGNRISNRTKRHKDLMHNNSLHNAVNIIALRSLKYTVRLPLLSSYSFFRSHAVWYFMHLAYREINISDNAKFAYSYIVYPDLSHPCICVLQMASVSGLLWHIHSCIEIHLSSLPDIFMCV